MVSSCEKTNPSCFLVSLWITIHDSFVFVKSSLQGLIHLCLFPLLTGCSFGFIILHNATKVSRENKQLCNLTNKPPYLPLRPVGCLEGRDPAVS